MALESASLQHAQWHAAPRLSSRLELRLTLLVLEHGGGVVQGVVGIEEVVGGGEEELLVALQGRVGDGRAHGQALEQAGVPLHVHDVLQGDGG